MKYKKDKIFLAFLSMMICLTFLPLSNAKDKTIQHEDFVQYLFDRLELVKPGTVLSLNEKIDALKELNFQPRNGYKPGMTLHYGEMADVLVNVYGLQDASKNYDETQEIQLLVDKNILKVKENPEKEVPFDLAVEIIQNIPQSPSYAQKTVLLPRYFKESTMSRCE